MKSRTEVREFYILEMLDTSEMQVSTEKPDENLYWKIHHVVDRAALAIADKELEALKADFARVDEEGIAMMQLAQRNHQLLNEKKSEAEALRSELDINRNSFSNLQRKLAEANERIVEFELHKEPFLKVQKELKKVNDILVEQISETGRDNHQLRKERDDYRSALEKMTEGIDATQSKGDLIAHYTEIACETLAKYKGEGT